MTVENTKCSGVLRWALYPGWVYILLYEVVVTIMAKIYTCCLVQIQLIEKPHSCPYLIYQEDISKTNQGSLNSRTKQLKEVIHYANIRGALSISIRHTCQGVHQIGLLVHFIFNHCLKQKVISSAKVP